VHLAGPIGLSTSQVRTESFVSGCAALGIEGRVFQAPTYTVEAGQQVMDEVLDSSDFRPTAVVAGNDLLALGVYHSLRLHGLRCPDDVSVVGFNDMPFAGDFQPPMTTVRTPHFELGVEAARLLLSQIEHSALTALRVVLPVELIVRASTGPVNERRDEH
jgi:LacI family transcriptional regulator